MLRFELLGGLKIERDGAELKGFISRKSQALLVYLAIKQQAHFREAIEGLFWAESSQSRAAGNLRVALNNLRQLIPGNLEITRSQIAFRPASPHWLDVTEFERQASQSHIQALQIAAGLYRGDFLAGFSLPDAQAFEEWLLIERERLRQIMLQTLHRLAAYYTSRGEYHLGIEATTRLLTLDPWREEAHRELMRLLALSGQRSAALTQYEQCRRLLARELGLEPLEETVTLYQQIKAWGQEPTLAAGNVQTNASALPALPFAGRQAEHALLLGWQQEARRGASRLTLIEGEGGIGKTRLVNEVLRYLETQGALVLQGRCYEFGYTLPYQPIADALRPLVEDARKLAKAPGAAAWLAELSGLLPEVRLIYPDLPAPLPTDWETARLRLFEAIRSCLETTAQRRMAVLFLDDLHWADSYTLDLLHYLIRQLHHKAIWIIGAYRPEEVDLNHPLTRLRQGLSRDHLVHCLTLPPLPPAAIAQITHTLFNGIEEETSLGDFLSRESEGNPFILAETIATLQEQDWLVCKPQIGWQWQNTPPPALLPSSVEALILQRVGRLSDAARELIPLAAVVGQRFDPALLAQAASLPLGKVEACLEEWIRRRLAYPLTDQSPFGKTHSPPFTTYDFSHDKIRTAVYGAIPPARRPALHAKIGEALESLRQERLEIVYEALAYHFEQACQSEKALHYLRLAGAKAASLYAHDQALEYYQRALNLCSPSDECRWAILVAQAAILALIGKYQQATVACQQVAANAGPPWQAQAYCTLAQISRAQRDYEAARCYALQSELAAQSTQSPSASADLRARALQAQAQVEREQGDLQRARQLFQSALEIYRQIGNKSGSASCLEGLGDVSSANSDYTQARSHYEQALSVFRSLNDLPRMAACLRAIATAAWRQQDYVTAQQAAAQSLEFSRLIGDRPGEAAALNNLGLSAIAQGDHPEAQRCWQASVSLYRELGLENRAAAGLHNLGISYMDSGNLQASRQCLEQALAINQAVGSQGDQALDLGWLGKLYWLRGDYPTAASCLEKALALDELLGSGAEQDWHLIWRALVACEASDLLTARRYLCQAEQALKQGGGNLKSWEIAHCKAALCLEEGKVETALQIVIQALCETQTDVVEINAQGNLLAMLARIYSHLGNTQEAQSCFEQALSQLPEIPPMIYERAMTLQHYAAFLEKSGETEHAAARRAEARLIFERVGASGRA